MKTKIELFEEQLKRLDGYKFNYENLVDDLYNRETTEIQILKINEAIVILSGIFDTVFPVEIVHEVYMMKTDPTLLLRVDKDTKTVWARIRSSKIDEKITKFLKEDKTDLFFCLFISHLKGLAQTKEQFLNTLLSPI